VIVEVVGFRVVNRGRLRAYADVKFGDGLVVRDFAVICGENQRPHIGPPRRSWNDNGSVYHTPVVSFVNGLREQVKQAILARIAEEEQRNGQTANTPATCHPS